MTNRANEGAASQWEVVPSSFHETWKCTHTLRVCVECGEIFEGCSMQNKQITCSKPCWERRFRLGENDKRERKGNRRKRLPPLEDGSLWCSSCESYRPLEDFTTSGGRVVSRCKPCSNAYQKKWASENREKVRVQSAASRRKNYPIHKFGITREEYEARRDAAEGCAICGGLNENGKALHLDHCHQTGALRGFLCENCNRGLGMFKDNPDILRSAARYLEDA